MGKLTHPKLIQAHEQNIEVFRTYVKTQRRKLEELEVSLILVEPLFPDLFVGEKIYCAINGGTKSEFSKAVETVAQLLGEALNISVNPGEYSADFETHKVQVFLQRPSDCKLIEVKEVVEKITTKPHPECLAALRVLEDIA